MKYQIKVLTPSGIKFFIYDDEKNKTLRQLENEIIQKHGSFVTLKTEKII